MTMQTKRIELHQLDYGIAHKHRFLIWIYKALCIASLLIAIWGIGQWYVFPWLDRMHIKIAAATQRRAAFNAVLNIKQTPTTVTFAWSSWDPPIDAYAPWYRLLTLDRQVMYSGRIYFQSGLAYHRLKPLRPDWDAYSCNIFMGGRRNSSHDQRIVILNLDWELFVTNYPTPFRAQIASWQGSLKPIKIAKSIDAYGFKFVCDTPRMTKFYAGNAILWTNLISPLNMKHLPVKERLMDGCKTMTH